MAVKEKISSRAASYSATGISIAAAVALWIAGAKKPDAYASGMAVNHHVAGYGTVAVECYACHVPVGSSMGFVTKLGCQEGGCHGALKPELPFAKAMELFREGKNESPFLNGKGEYSIKLHAEVASQECVECHTEHTSEPTKIPPGWKSWAETQEEIRKDMMKQQSRADFESVLDRRG